MKIIKTFEQYTTGQELTKPHYTTAVDLENDKNEDNDGCPTENKIAYPKTNLPDDISKKNSSK